MPETIDAPMQTQEQDLSEEASVHEGPQTQRAAFGDPVPSPVARVAGASARGVEPDAEGPPTRQDALGTPVRPFGPRPSSIRGPEALDTRGQDVRDTDPASGDPGHGPSVREVQFAEAPVECHPGEGRGGTAAGAGQFDILLDMSVPVSVVLGQTQIPVRRLLQLGPGSILQLEKPVQTPADLYLQDAKFAEVDVVVVEDRFAVRIRKIVGAN